MDTNVQAFIDEIISSSPALLLAYQKHLEYWGSEDVLGIIVLGDLGHALVDEFAMHDTISDESIFLKIEAAATSDDETLATYVVTGLIEAVAGQAGRAGVWARLRRKLGPYSVEHGDWWLNFNIELT
jgi:hypothetical protein